MASHPPERSRSSRPGPADAGEPEAGEPIEATSLHGQRGGPVPRPGRRETGRQVARDAAQRPDRMPVRLAAIGLIVALVALGLGLRSLILPGGSGCPTLAWNALPAQGSLPDGWSIAASDFTLTGVTSTLSGPAATDGSGSTSTVYTTVSCFGGDASEAVSRSRAAASAAGQSVSDAVNVGDEGYSTTDASSSAMAIHFRRGMLVGYAASDGSTSASDLDAIATAFDSAMQRAEAGGTPPPAALAGSTAPGSEGSASGSATASAGSGASPPASGEPSGTPAASAAPELEALLPAVVGSTTLTRDSAVGTDVLGSAASSRALASSLRSLGADPATLHVAEAYDDSGANDLSILAFGIAGVSASKLTTSIVDTWLSGHGPGVKTSSVTLSGRDVTKVDYGDSGAVSYVVTEDHAVIVIETSDADLAKQAAAALP